VKEHFNKDCKTYFAQELQQLAPMVEDGLISIDDAGIFVHNAGRMLIRRICMVFDEYLNNGTQIRYSKII
jgi:oxygen-independent coproporphyrinogen-3 oxidase